MTKKKINYHTDKVRKGRKAAVSDDDFFKIIKINLDKVINENNAVYPLSNPIWNELSNHPDFIDKLSKSTIYKKVYDDWKKPDSKLKNLEFEGYGEKAPKQMIGQNTKEFVQECDDNLRVNTLGLLHSLKKDANFTMSIKDINIFKFSVGNFGLEELDAWKSSCEIGLIFIFTSGGYRFQCLEIDIDEGKKYTSQSISELSLFSIIGDDAIPLGSFLQEEVDRHDVKHFFLDVFRHMQTIYFPRTIFVIHSQEVMEGLSLAIYGKSCEEYSDMCLRTLENEESLSDSVKTGIKVDVSVILDYFCEKNCFKDDDQREFFTKSIILLSQCLTLRDFRSLLEEIFVIAGTECIAENNMKTVDLFKKKIKDVDSSLYLRTSGTAKNITLPTINPGSKIFIFIDEVMKNAQKSWIKATSHHVNHNEYYLNKEIIHNIKEICLEFLFWSDVVNNDRTSYGAPTKFYMDLNNFAKMNEGVPNEISDFITKLIIFKQDILKHTRFMLQSQPKMKTKKVRTMPSDPYKAQENGEISCKSYSPQTSFHEDEHKDTIEELQSNEKSNDGSRIGFDDEENHVSLLSSKETSYTERIANFSDSTDSSEELYSSCFRWSDRQLIQNGLLMLSPVEFEGTLFCLINTCPLDSFFEVAVACNCFWKSFNNFVTKKEFECIEKNIFSMIYQYHMSDFSREVYYQLRVDICKNLLAYESKEEKGCLKMDCKDSIDIVLNKLLKDDCPITKITKCKTCGYNNEKTYTSEYLDTTLVEKDQSLCAMKDFLEKKYSTSKRNCYNNECNGTAKVTYKIKDWLCVQVETSYLIHENAFATLSKIPSTLTFKKEDYILTGVIAFKPPPQKAKMKECNVSEKAANNRIDDYRESGLAHYFSYIRFTDGQWEKRDSLLGEIVTYTKKTKEKVKPAILFYVQRNNHYRIYG